MPPLRPSVVNKGVGVIVARAAGEDRAMDEAADKVLLRALQIAQSHRLTGSYLKSFGVAELRGKKGVMDREVYNDDPAAHVIESGSVRRTKSGPRHIAGQFVLTKAAKTTPGVT